MTKLKADSPVSRRIVTAFLDFLNCVEHASSSADAEAVEVAKECLTEAFKIDSSAVDSQPLSNLMLEIFTKLEAFGHQGDTTSVHTRGVNSSTASTSSVANKSHICSVEASKSQGCQKMICAHSFLLHWKRFIFSSKMLMVTVIQTTLIRRHTIFMTPQLIWKVEPELINLTNLAESLKSQGNKAMQSKAYYDAIELYTCAIAVFDTNAVYYCNRAAAFTYVHKYSEAVVDCLKSIEIDPNYSKAYSRLGLAYYAQGNYGAAISKGFRKGLCSSLTFS
uniref:SGTA homodimerisation domain-containing protein n=1 Tax=Kalanchoe fedtschenkoi TaxID=63787 RepID=A0A7N0UNC2_KALFE